MKTKSKTVRRIGWAKLALALLLLVALYTLTKTPFPFRELGICVALGAFGAYCVFALAAGLEFFERRWSSDVIKAWGPWIMMPLAFVVGLFSPRAVVSRVRQFRKEAREKRVLESLTFKKTEHPPE
jgi:hypothetical protein